MLVHALSSVCVVMAGLKGPYYAIRCERDRPYYEPFQN